MSMEPDWNRIGAGLCRFFVGAELSELEHNVELDRTRTDTL